MSDDGYPERIAKPGGTAATTEAGPPTRPKDISKLFALCAGRIGELRGSLARDDWALVEIPGFEPAPDRVLAKRRRPAALLADARLAMTAATFPLQWRKPVTFRGDTQGAFVADLTEAIRAFRPGLVPDTARPGPPPAWGWSDES